jgi:hypothetical protein
MMAIICTLFCGVAGSFKGSEASIVFAIIFGTSSFPAEGPSVNVSSIVSATIVLFVVFCNISLIIQHPSVIYLAALNVLAVSEY